MWYFQRRLLEKLSKMERKGQFWLEIGGISFCFSQILRMGETIQLKEVKIAANEITEKKVRFSSDVFLVFALVFVPSPCLMTSCRGLFNFSGIQ